MIDVMTLGGKTDLLFRDRFLSLPDARLEIE